MGAASNYLQKLLLDWSLTDGSVSRPTEWFLALYTDAPSDAGGGTEVSGNGYARQAVTFAAASSPEGETSNTNTVNFEASGGSWGEVTHIGVFDAASGGNLLWHGALEAPALVTDSDDVEFVPGSVVIALD